MATLPDYNPRYNSPKETGANVLKADLGDGYSQAAANGINSLKDTWNLEWKINTTGANVLILFFEARKGYESFGWTPSGESVEKRFRCKSWSKSFIHHNLVMLIAEFEQVYTNV